MIQKRFEHIDFLRAVAIVGVVAIHTLSYHLNNKIYYLWWNYLNFVVVSFVFCSGYVLTARYKEKFRTEINIVRWYLKRFWKLVFPFYIYLIVHYLLWMLFPQFFAGLGLQKSTAFIVKSVLFIGGVDLNWLPLLFFQLTVLFPILMQGLHKKKILYSYIIFSSVVTLIFTIIRFPYEYFRNVMWISWSVILLVAFYIVWREHAETDHKKIIRRYMYGAAVSAAVFGLLVILHFITKRSFQLVDYKYPPGLYYISYGFCITFLILIAGEFAVYRNMFVKKISLFLSKHSYSLFFTHYVVLDFVLKMTKNKDVWSNPLLQFIVVLTVSLFICEGIAWLKSAYDSKVLRSAKRG